MALYGAFDSKRLFLELADNDVDHHGNLLTPTERRDRAFQNLTGDGSILASEVAALQGLTAISAELNLLDGSVEANSVVSVAPLLDSGGDLRTASNVGTKNGATVSVAEYGDGFNHTTVLTLTATPLTVGSSEDLAVGVLVYTLPAGANLINSAYMSVAVDAGSVSATADTPEVGLGTVIGSGVVSVLSTTLENIITGQVATDTNGTATVKGAGPTGSVPLEIATGGAHTVHLNMADGWGANADADGTLSGTIVLNWTFQV